MVKGHSIKDHVIAVTAQAEAPALLKTSRNK